MKLALVLLFTVFHELVNGETKCGISKVNFNSRWKIIGGVPAKPQEFPWQISVKGSSTERHKCGGTIISDQWLMTAAHCESTVTIEIGVTNFDERDGKEIKVEIAKWIRHPLDKGSSKNQYDVALIKIKQKLDFEGEHDYLAPICLATPEDDENFENKRCVASGWGYKADHILPPDLQKVELPVLTNEDCKPIFTWMNERTICAGGEGIKSICNGDSGGPLQCRRDDGSWTQVGISSFVKGDCLSDKPGGFARVSAVRNWILETIANE